MTRDNFKHYINLIFGDHLENNDEIIAFLNSLYEDYLDNLPDV